jgi:hypothetical protein
MYHSSDSSDKQMQLNLDVQGAALAQLWSQYGRYNTVREDTAGIVRIVILYLYVDRKIFIRIQNDLR